jgi:hypothetical protein
LIISEKGRGGREGEDGKGGGEGRGKGDPTYFIE